MGATRIGELNAARPWGALHHALAPTRGELRGVLDVGEIEVSRRSRRGDDRHMEIDYNAHVIVRGVRPTTGFYRGERASGALDKMIPVTLDYISKRYTSVMIAFVSGETWGPDKIKEVSQRADFPK